MNTNQGNGESLLLTKDKITTPYEWGRVALLMLASLTFFNLNSFIFQTFILQTDVFFSPSAISYYALKTAMQHDNIGFTILAVVLSFAMIAAFVTFWFLSVKRQWAYIAGFVLAMINSAVLIVLISIGYIPFFDDLIEIILHILIDVWLIKGIVNMMRSTQ